MVEEVECGDAETQAALLAESKALLRCQVGADISGSMHVWIEVLPIRPDVGNAEACSIEVLMFYKARGGIALQNRLQADVGSAENRLRVYVVLIGAVVDESAQIEVRGVR